MSLISAHQLGCEINQNKILSQLNFEIEKGSITSILGPSGSGKSTLLQVIAGFTPINEGELFIQGESVARKGYNLAPEKRRIGMVFQDASLFQHLSVYDNIKAGAHLVEASRRDTLVDEMIEIFQLGHLIKHYPHELSGGQQQRAALARTLVYEPDILLLDEPFANLNQDLQNEIGGQIYPILNQRGTTVILVTHDQYDAIAISQQVLVLMDGRVVQQASPLELFTQPVNCEVAAFISRGSFIPGALLTSSHALSCQTAFGPVKIHQQSATAKKDAVIWVQPEDFKFVDNHGADAIVERITWRTTDVLLHAKLIDDFVSVIIKADQHCNVAIGDKVTVALKDKTYNAY